MTSDIVHSGLISHQPHWLRGFGVRGDLPLTSTDQSILLLIIIPASGLVTAWISSLSAVVGRIEKQTNQFPNNIVGFLPGCVLSGFGIVGWFLFLR